MRYRRVRLPGATYFFTLVTRDRAPIFADAGAVARLAQAFRHVRARRPFATDALVVLPDHVHALWTLPEDNADFSTRRRLVKHFVRRASPEPIWQPRFWEHAIRDELDFARHFDYIHANPVKHRLAKHAGDWPYSTFKRWVKQGVYSPDWLELDPDLDLE